MGQNSSDDEELDSIFKLDELLKHFTSDEAFFQESDSQKILELLIAMH